MSVVELPGLWLDHIELVATEGIWLVNQSPEDGDTGVAKAASFSLELFSTELGVAVDLPNTQVYVGGVLAYDGGAGGFQAGFAGAGSAVVALGATDQRITVDPTTDWASEQLVAVRVVSQTVGASYSLDETYSFTAEDYIVPTVLSATATSSTVVRVVFSEGMRRTAATGVDDALNPALYAVTHQPIDDREAAVWVLMAGVVQAADTSVAGDTFDLTVDMDMTFGKTYAVTFYAIADEAGNLLAAPVIVSFTSWSPPSWPATRVFSHYDLFARDDRDRDIHGDLERLCSVWQDTTDVVLWEQDRFPDIWDIDAAPEPFIDALLQDLGNPFKFDLTLLEKRKLAAILVASYKERGTAGSIINLAQFFMGLTVSVTNWASEQWILDVSLLGVDTLCGPSAANGNRELYTFTVESTTVLSDDERRMLGQIIDEVKPAHTHYVIIDPDDYTVVDHWSLGESELDESTDLHE